MAGVLARQARGSCQDAELVLSQWLNVIDGGPGAEALTPPHLHLQVMPVLAVNAVCADSNRKCVRPKRSATQCGLEGPSI